MSPRKRLQKRSPSRLETSSERSLQESIEDIYKAVGASIAEHRGRRALTQDQLSEAAGLSQNHLARIERGMRRVSLAQLETLAKALGVTLSDLLPEREAGAHVRLPSSVTTSWSTLSTSDRRLVLGLLERLAK